MVVDPGQPATPQERSKADAVLAKAVRDVEANEAGRNNTVARVLGALYNFVKVVGSRVDDAKSMHREILSMTRSLFGDSILRSAIKTSAELSLEHAVTVALCIMKIAGGKRVADLNTHGR